MKIKSGYQLCDVGDSSIVIANGEASMDMSSLTTLNETGAYLWKLLETEKTEDEVLDIMTKEFDIDRATAAADFKEFVKKLEGAGFLE